MDGLAALLSFTLAAKAQPSFADTIAEPQFFQRAADFYAWPVPPCASRPHACGAAGRFSVQGCSALHIHPPPSWRYQTGELHTELTNCVLVR